ncbi:hypothetical protein [Staphylothermus hellenicus]|uniref:Transcriptional regulator n=1 Tax=Staphylothermus hellenicus (strain DSM 12710 / JCM 10830 / BK20S6-10-b1 / P8) TaxID=591019 RepID=D7DA60_STAHD|nr:hypothetical protein [Staphylothermus hellenicus]ADI32656.1 hypothetical protein Shell_1568 [Staphylothermus hellenicus DSM 12710]
MVSRAAGLALFLSAILLAVVYIYGLIIAPDTIIWNIKLSDLLIRLTTLFIMLTISFFLGYMGYSIFTSPTPRPIEEIAKEYMEKTKQVVSSL